MTECIHKSVNDLGIAAYLIMHGYSVIGKKGRLIYFECQNEKESSEFDNLILDYQPPNDFYTFDSCLMFLKKINDHDPKKIQSDTHKIVSDLGVAAYLLMREYDSESKIGIKIVGKRGKFVYFEHPKEKSNEFERRSYQYLSSQFQAYDSNLMALKKIGEYMPTDDIRSK